MMISPNQFYEIDLKGKNKRQIRAVIDGLRINIKRLKDVIENPEYTPTCCPDERTQLFCNQEYLEMAKKPMPIIRNAEERIRNKTQKASQKCGAF